jgi:hypothetical protein
MASELGAISPAEMLGLSQVTKTPTCEGNLSKFWSLLPRNVTAADNQAVAVAGIV